MKPETILKKAIEKAVKNGWKFNLYEVWDVKTDYKEHKLKPRNGVLEIYEDGKCIALYPIDDIIFSHDFAKAFFPKRTLQPDCDCGVELGENHKKDCAAMTCQHCGVDIAYGGKKGVCNHIHYPDSCPVCSANSKGWQYHLQQMVLEKDPIKYLEKHL